MSLATDTIHRNTCKSKRCTIQKYRRSSPYKVVMYIQKLHRFCNTSSPVDGPKSAESIWDINNYGKYINQFPPNTMKSIWQYERINKKIYRQKMSLMFNEICINEEMLSIYIYIYIYIGFQIQTSLFTLSSINMLIVELIASINLTLRN